MANGWDKPLDRMDRLSDMAHFPPLVNAGATLNVLITIAITWTLVPRFGQVYAPLAWTALVLCLNLLPVIVLRASDAGDRPMPRLSEMDFFRDQHRFSDWVYLAASANMSFWILLSWSIFSVRHTVAALVAVLAVALLATFSPVLLRRLRAEPR